jgi:hypothetical protein
LILGLIFIRLAGLDRLFAAGGILRNRNCHEKKNKQGCKK